jgi:hypothetical protein
VLRITERAPINTALVDVNVVAEIIVETKRRVRPHHIDEELGMRCRLQPLQKKITHRYAVVRSH